MTDEHTLAMASAATMGVTRELARALAEIQRLRVALERYGKHRQPPLPYGIPACQAWANPVAWACTCGFTAALAAEPAIFRVRRDNRATAASRRGKWAGR